LSTHKKARRTRNPNFPAAKPGPTEEVVEEGIEEKAKSHNLIFPDYVTRPNIFPISNT
jgi:hypothetical protein